MEPGAEFPQALLDECATQDGVEKPAPPCIARRQQIDPRQKMRKSNHLASVSGADHLALGKEVCRDLRCVQSLRPLAGVIVHPYRPELIARLTERVVVPGCHGDD